MDIKIPLDIENAFKLSFACLQKIIYDFHSEIDKGLSGKASSLKMLPTYADVATGKEKGRFIALDLGGTNFRVLEAELKGKGRIIKLREKKFVLEKKYTTGTALAFFDFIASCIKDFAFASRRSRGRGKEESLGFTFSFPVRQIAIASGLLITWTKGFSVSGVQGCDVVKLLKAALIRQQVKNIKVTALVNDTVGTLASRSYKDVSTDTAIILGTGTNACYRGKISGRKMIINIEWGNFNKLNRTKYDELLDQQSNNPDKQILEKMVSGMYLGEITRLVMKDLAARKILFNGAFPQRFKAVGSFKTEYMSALASGKSLGFGSKDKALAEKICALISQRAASISAASLGAVITKMDAGLKNKHTVAIDGSVYEKYPGFAKNMRKVLKQLFGAKHNKIKLVLTKDGSGLGAAVVAAVAQGENDK